MNAILWDGNKQLNGDLEFKKNLISFRLTDFQNTNLDFDVEYADIQEVKYCNVFNLVNKGIEIVTKAQTKNIFILDNPKRAKSLIDNKLRVR